MNKLIIWVLVGFIAVTILVGLGLSIGYLSAYGGVHNATMILFVSLASGVIGAWYFYALYPLYARGRRLAIYLSIFFVALALVLPVIDGPPERRADLFAEFEPDLFSASSTYYAPGFNISDLLNMPLVKLAPGLLTRLSEHFLIKYLEYFLIVNGSWVFWGLLGLGIGYLLQKPSKRISDEMSR